MDVIIVSAGPPISPPERRPGPGRRVWPSTGGPPPLVAPSGVMQSTTAVARRCDLLMAEWPEAWDSC
jgi:hypothetical protein